MKFLYLHGLGQKPDSWDRVIKETKVSDRSASLSLAEMLEGKIWPAKKPDSDNIAKVVLDALNGIAYHDDTQIIKLSVTKAYKEEAYLSVTLMELK